MKKIILLLTIAFINLSSFNNINAQCGSGINFSTDWSKKGPTSAGTWVVSGGGSTVTQTINGLPTFYVSGTNYIDVKINGTFQVNTTGDDDWVGFVFGYQNPITPATGSNQKYYLFDWKQTNQTSATCYTIANEGFSLVEVDTSVDLTNTCTNERLYWGHNSYPGFNVLATDYGSTKGWNDFAVNTFSLTYTSKLIVIVINGDTIFNIPGCYEPGRFGFYNLSQDQSVYSNFSYELISDFDFAPTNSCTNQSVNLDAINDACLSGPYVSPITSWSWNLGDGTIVNDTNITHTYTDPGTYNVTLTVADGTGCLTPITKPFVVNGLKVYRNDSIICPSANTTIWCNNPHPGVLYQWFRNGIAVTTPTLNDTTFLVTLTGNYHVEITNFGSYSCNTTSNSVTVTQENLSIVASSSAPTVCSGANVIYSTSTISGAQYEWFINGVSQGIGTNTLSSNATGTFYVNVTTSYGCLFSSNTITTVAGTNPIATITSSGTGFCPGDSVSLASTLSAGESIQWYINGTIISGATSTSYIASASGNYTAIITNTNGCNDVSNLITISAFSNPTATITSSAPNFCPGITSITLTSNTLAGASYQWFLNGTLISGATSNTYNATVAGNYTIQITSVNGCIGISSITNLQTATVSTFTVTAPTTTFCDGSSVAISTQIEAGSSYSWYNNTTLAGGPSTTLTTFNVTNGGTYYAFITNSFGCTTNSDTVVIIENPLPTASISTTSTSFCPSDSTLLSAVYVSGATYQWFHNGSAITSAVTGGNTYYATLPGLYQVTVDNGCSNNSNTLSISVSSSPSAAGSIIGANTFCQGETISFFTTTASGATYYNWVITPASAASIGSGQGTTSIDINTTNQNFTITVTPQNSCGNGTSTSMSVTLNPSWMCSGIMFAANTTNICVGNSITFTNYTDPTMYFGATANWNFGAGASPATATGYGPHTVSYSTAGIKTVVLSYVDNFSGMTIDDLTKINYINVNGTVSTSAISGATNVSCSSTIEIYSVTNTIGSTYNWSVPSGATIISGMGTSSIQVQLNGNNGTITVQETTLVGCTGAVVSTSINITGAPITSLITGNTTINCSSVLETYNVINTIGSTYLWTVPAGATILSGQGTNSIDVNFNGNMGSVTVVETNASGCDGAVVTLNINCTSGIAEMNEIMLNVFPNPTSENLTIELNSQTDFDYFIYDLQGKEILKGSMNNQNSITINVETLSSGTYVGKIIYNNTLRHFKFSKY